MLIQGPIKFDSENNDETINQDDYNNNLISIYYDPNYDILSTI